MPRNDSALEGMVSIKTWAWAWIVEEAGREGL